MIILIFIIILTFVYFLTKTLFNKFYKGKQNKKNILIIVISAVLTPLLMAVYFFTILFIAFYYPDLEFDKISWMEESHTRYKMTDNIIESKMLIGLNISEVELLLGTNYYSPNSKTIIYQIGALPGILVLNQDLLVISFDDDLVSSIRQETAKSF